MKLIGLSGSLIGSKTAIGVDTVLQFVKKIIRKLKLN